MNNNLEIKTAFHYPFNKPKRMLNILWIFLPIVGWFALGGYGIKIIQGFTAGKFDNLPVFEFRKDLNLGFFMFLKSLPFILVYFIYLILSEMITLLFPLTLFINIFLVPILSINFFHKQTISSLFEFKILKYVFLNLKEYIFVMLKTILLSLIFSVMILILIGFPALIFTRNIFLADFYRRQILPKEKE